MRQKPFLILLIVLGLGFGLKAQKDTLIHHEVRFKLDSDRINSREKAILDSLLVLYPMSITKELKLYGHTDSLADIDYNRDLSKRRVQAVLQYLVYKGLDPLLVKTDYYGEERPRYSNAPEERYKNRRVELEFVLDLSLMPDPERKLSEQSLKTGDKVRLANLNFVGNQPIPMWHSMDELRELLLVMQRNPDLEIALQGHVCCSNDYELSVARAKMVYDFLLDQGISKLRLEYRGYGNRVPLFEETNEENRALNRRVEVEVLHNSDRRVKAEAKKKLRFEAPVLSVQFISGTARLSPSGDFMLGLIAEMLNESEDIQYEVKVYDTVDNSRLTAQRAKSIERSFRTKRVDRKKIKVSHHKALPGMLKSADYNTVRVEITEL